MAHIEVPHVERVGSIQDPYVVPATIDDPLIRLDWDRRLNSAGNPLWKNSGRLGAAGDFVGAGGAANPTKLGDLPGYGFDADRLTAAPINFGTRYSFVIVRKLAVTTGAHALFAGTLLPTQHYVFYHGIGTPVPLYHNANNVVVSVSFFAKYVVEFLGVSRNDTKVRFYLNGEQVGAEQTLASNPDLILSTIGAFDTGIHALRGEIYAIIAEKSPMPTSYFKAKFESERHIYGV